ncbi:MAG: redoxin domain-containing protein [Candidatus Aenigmatarchaeota archaeon]
MSRKRNIIYLAAILIALIGSFFAYPIISADASKVSKTITGNVIAESAPAEDIYKMFLCPCCGQVLDKKNICCEMAGEMISYIDSQLGAGLSKNEVVMKAAEKYGINSVVEPKREAVKAELAKRNPDSFPKDKLSFSQAIGQKAPDFTLQSIEGMNVKLNDYKGKIVVLFFNEGSMCYPACWDQMAALGNDARFDTDDVITFSILADQKSEWEKIVNQVPKLSKAKILFDTTRAVSSAYDVLSLKSSMHPGNYPGHTYFIIDKDGIVRYTLDDPAMAIRNDKLAAELEKLG